MTSDESSDSWSYSRRARHFATMRPDASALIVVARDGGEATMTWRELDRNVNRTAHLLAARGVGSDSLVTIGLPTCAEHVVAALAAWRLGACTLPLSPELPDRERHEISAVCATWRPVTALITGEPRPGAVTLGELRDLASSPDEPASDQPLPDLIPHPGKAICSGGSTGRPKIIVDDRPWVKVPGHGSTVHAFGLTADQTQLVTGRLYHNIAFSLTHNGLFEGHTVILMEKFDAALAVDLIERHRVSFLGMVPIVMQRIARLPDIESRDLSSIEAFYHSGAMCPPWVKQAWLKLVAPQRQYDCYGGAEGTGVVAIRGDDWAQHPGSIGKPVQTIVRILDPAGMPVPPGVIGEIFTRPESGPPTFRYFGAEPPRPTQDGLVSLGDMGWQDDDGYLHLADRRVDLIISGGANVYPAEVEAVLSEHPAVSDVAVVGVDDDEWGKRVHAIVLPEPGVTCPDEAELRQFCRERILPYKVPKTIEFVAQSFRDESGKIRRSQLAAIRQPASSLESPRSTPDGDAP